MDYLQTLIDWLADNESAFSAVAAIAVIAGVFYGALRFILQPLLQARERRTELAKNALVGEPSELDANQTNARSKTEVASESQHAIAILLFEALSSNKDDEFLASGISSEVISHITQIPNIRVSSRLASFAYRSGRDDINLVSEQLSTRYIVTGSLRRSDQRIIVIAELTDTATQTEIWVQTYDRQIDDLFDVQRDIAKCIVGALLGEVKLAESNFARTITTDKLDAWGLAQKAYHFWLSNFSGEGVLQAVEYLQKALQIDPDYHAARAALAMLISQMMNSRITPDFDSSAREARELIQTAYRNAPNDIDVLENAGLVWMTLSEPELAQNAARRAVELAPLNLIARGYLALVLTMTGGKEGAQEAIDLIDENFSIAPTHPSTPYWHHFKALAMQCIGEHEQAIELANLCVKGHPSWTHSYFIRANSMAMLGDVTNASSSIQTAIEINPYLTAELHAQNVREMTADSEKAQLFLEGLKSNGFIV